MHLVVRGDVGVPVAVQPGDCLVRRQLQVHVLVGLMPVQVDGFKDRRGSQGTGENPKARQQGNKAKGRKAKRQ